MTWGGTGGWGAGSPWGTGSGEAAAPPTLSAVASEHGTTAPSSGPAVIAVRGGTICRVVGSSFFASAAAPFVTIEFLIGVAPYTAVGTGYVFDPALDVTASRIIFGAPALEKGLYHLRVTTAGGSSGVLEDVIAARFFAEEYKTLSVRGKFSAKWATGPRILRG